MKAQEILYVFHSYNTTPNWVFSPKNQKKKKNSMYNITNSVFKPRKFSKYNITNSVFKPRKFSMDNITNLACYSFKQSHSKLNQMPFPWPPNKEITKEERSLTSCSVWDQIWVLQTSNNGGFAAPPPFSFLSSFFFWFPFAFLLFSLL